MAIDTSGMITVAEAAKRMHRSQEQVRRNLRDGKLRGQRIGNQWFVDAHQPLSEPKPQAARGGYLSPDFLARIKARRAELARRGPLPDIVQMVHESREGR